jgi:hypothetical protein
MLTFVLAFVDVNNLIPGFGWWWYVLAVLLDLLYIGRGMNTNNIYVTKNGKNDIGDRDNARDDDD